jgi:predicted ATPase
MEVLMTSAHKRRIVLSGCSGGGKSSLLGALAQRGYAVFPEPWRLVLQERAENGASVDDTAAVARMVLERAIAFHAAAKDGVTFYDRSVLDTLAWFVRSGTPVPAHLSRQCEGLRYDPLVFLTPPWPEIYVQDAERRHGLADAIAEFDHLEAFFPANGYETVLLPKASIGERIDLIRKTLYQIA